MRRLKDMFFVFVCVTTCVLFVTAVYTTIFFQGAVFGVEIFWQILAVSFLCSIANFFYPQQEASKKTMMLLRIGHYILTNVIVLGCGIWFGWFYADNLPMVLVMVVAIAVVFVIVSAAAWKKGRQQAALMNERLRMYQQDEDT